MHEFLRHSVSPLLASLLVAMLLAGCGHKEAPQPVADSSVKPQLLGLQYEQAGNVLKLSFKLRGDPSGVGYQIDRTQIDPYCQCPGFWRRYHDQQPLADLVNRTMKKIINLKTTKIEFVYRLRPIDINGNFGPWSKSIRARGVDLFNK
ncbi:MAG: hypothetical protein Q9M08_01980 [Mariprofundus sp.]|nr:hypothetical protein [Mariprofundus sp.]